MVQEMVAGRHNRIVLPPVLDCLLDLICSIHGFDSSRLGHGRKAESENPRQHMTVADQSHGEGPHTDGTHKDMAAA